jgi:DNA primase
MTSQPHQPEHTKPVRDELLAANEAAAEYFRHRLLTPGGEGPRSYLAVRGFTAYLKDTPWTVGYAPASWTSARDHLVERGFSDDVLDAAGLVCRTRRGTTIDKFRDRITFGLRDTDGNLTGFTSRAAPGAGDRTPKYLNCRHTALFDKSAALFGLGEQTSRLRAGGTLVLVEGPLDALAVDLVNHDRDDALAPLALCGTAFTPAHAQVLAPLLSGPIVTAFDGDQAGLKASRTCYQSLATDHRCPSAAALRLGSDPASVLEDSGTDGLRHRLYDLTPLADRLIDGLITSWPHLAESAEARVACLRSSARLVATFTKADATRQMRTLPARLDLDADTVARELVTERQRHHPGQRHQRGLPSPGMGGQARSA